MPSSRLNHQLVGDFIAYEQQYHAKDATDFARQLGVSRSTVYRLFDGDPAIKAATYRRAETVLQLPEYALDNIRHEDVEELRSGGLTGRPMRWVENRIAEAEPPVNTTTGRGRNHRVG